MSVIPGIYENGVVRLLGLVDLPEGSRVEVVARRVDSPEPSVPNLDQDETLDAIYEVLSHRYDGDDPEMKQDENLDAIHEILSRRHHSGRNDVAARHNEHQP